MKVLKGYVRNRNRPEGCIVEGYMAEESIECCSEYLHDLESIGLRDKVDQDYNVSRGVTNGAVHTVAQADLLLAHQAVLQNSSVVQPFIE